MRYIRPADGLSINFSHAATENEGLTTVTLNIELDGNKYMKGTNIIECIKERLLPNFTIAAITQEITENEIKRIGGLVIYGVIQDYVVGDNDDYDGYVFLRAMEFLSRDDASYGIISFELGKHKPTYTP